MADETLTLALHGEVSLDAFATAIEHWRGLVDALTKHAAGGEHIEWVIDELSAGSATATVRAVSQVPDAALPVVDAYVEVGEALWEGRLQALDQRLRADAVALTTLIDGAVEFIRLETAKRDLVITTNYDEVLQAAVQVSAPVPMPAALGGVQGRIQTLTSRGALRFTLYDSLFDKAVNCYLAPGQEEIMRDVWGESAVVEGLVTRDPDSGRPVNVRDVWNVTRVRHVERSAYAEARGAIAVTADDRRAPEDLVTAARDA